MILHGIFEILPGGLPVTRSQLPELAELHPPTGTALNVSRTKSDNNCVCSHRYTLLLYSVIEFSFHRQTNRSRQNGVRDDRPAKRGQASLPRGETQLK